MWINKDVNIPEALITAQREGKLVIFAGAGISMGPLSNLPNFSELAEQVAVGVLERHEGETFDRFLGRLEDWGIDVQARTRTSIDDPRSKTNPIHYLLVDLFGLPNHLRLVTTNFDSHLTTAAWTRYSDGIDIYYAPAFPLGREFKGIVYLHGSIKRPERLILTDVDFGRAYLTDGWATRFLMEMFISFTVLFVGYSHDDSVMQYLARGFVGRTARYALTLMPPGNDKHWTHLGITPVHYPERKEPEKHGALAEAFKDWAKLAEMGTLDHERRIKQIVQSPPPLEPDILDYMESIVQDEVTLRYFVKYAYRPEWLHWAEEKGAFDELFVRGNITDARPGKIAQWFAGTFVVQHAREALDLVRRKGVQLNPTLWYAIARELAIREQRPGADILSRWSLVLVNSMGPGWDAWPLGDILKKCSLPEDEDTVLLLFSRLVRPEFELRRPWSKQGGESSEPRISIEITLPGDQYELQKAWTDYFRPSMNQLHGPIRQILASFFLKTHLFIKASGEGSPSWDPLSYRRSAIEPHEQNRHPDNWEFMVDAARDLLEWLLENELEGAETLIEEWCRAEPFLLKRIAIHGMVENQHLTSNDALKVIEDRNWLYFLPLKHEVYRLIERAFPSASESAQRQFIDYSMHASVPSSQEYGTEDYERREITDYERYNVAGWLNRISPESLIARKHFKQLQDPRPDFEPREHPDFDHWSTGFHRVVPKSPMTADELVKGDPVERLDWLLSYDVPEDFRRGKPDREGLLSEVQLAVGSSFAWSWQLARTLVDKSAWSADLWASIFGGWKEYSLTSEQGTEIVGLLEQNRTLYTTWGYEIVSLLENLIDREDGMNPTGFLERVEIIADRLMDSLKQQEPVRIVGTRDWLAKAINLTAGRIAMLWLKTLSKHRASIGDAWLGLPEGYQIRLEKTIYDDRLNAQFARIVLSSQSHFLFDLDPPWTKEHLVTLFDWASDALRAEQAWHGFLVWGRWNDALFGAMLPFVRQTFGRLIDELSDVYGSLCNRLADVAAYSLLDPWHGGWLSDFIREADPKSRTKWAASFGRNLKSLNSEAATRLWQQWISEYWSERITGVPQPFADNEIEAMLLWSIGLQNQFDEVVEKIVSASTPTEISTSTFYRLRENNIASLHPQAMGRLLLHLLSNATSIPYACAEVFALAKSALEGGASQDDLIAVADLMGRLDCRQARKLRDLVEESG